MAFKFSDIPAVTPGRNAEARAIPMGDMFMDHARLRQSWLQAQMQADAEQARLAEQARQHDDRLRFDVGTRALTAEQWGLAFDQRERDALEERRQWEATQAETARKEAAGTLLAASKAHEDQDVATFSALTSPALAPRGLQFSVAQRPAPKPSPAPQAGSSPSSPQPAESAVSAPPAATPESIAQSSANAASTMAQTAEQAQEALADAVAQGDAEGAKAAADAAGLQLHLEPPGMAQQMSSGNITSLGLGGSLLGAGPPPLETTQRVDPSDPLGGNDIVATFNGQEVMRLNWQGSRDRRKAQFEAFANGIGESLEDPLDRKAHNETVRILGPMSRPIKESTERYQDLFTKLRNSYQMGINAQNMQMSRADQSRSRAAAKESSDYITGRKQGESYLSKANLIGSGGLLTRLAWSNAIRDEIQRNTTLKGDRRQVNMINLSASKAFTGERQFTNADWNLMGTTSAGIMQDMLNKLGKVAGMDISEQEYKSLMNGLDLMQRQNESQARAAYERVIEDVVDYPFPYGRMGMAQVLREHFNRVGIWNPADNWMTQRPGDDDSRPAPTVDMSDEEAVRLVESGE